MRLFFIPIFGIKGTPQPTKGGAMALSNIDIATILSMEESQTFDRKSINIAPRDFSNHVCAFANADGGIIVVGISDKSKRIEGVDSRERQVNELLRVPMDFCMPTVPFVHEFVDCVDSTGRPNHVLVFHIEASPLVHENQAHDAYIRVGDKSKVLSYEDRMTLSLDKGLRSFEDILVPDSSYDDIDEVYLKEYLQMIGYSKFGAEMNVVKDVIFDGRVLEQVRQVVESPGNLPSQVKIDKIRNAHFARNSHIAEYLKDYKYVKDFGEGVDRMYREMEAFGLPVPEYRQDSFILKAVIKNSGFDCKNLGIGAKNLGIDAQNLGIGAKNLGIEQIKMAILNSHVNLTSKNKLIKLTEKIDINQVFGAKEVMAELKCSPPTATNLIKLLKALHLIEPVKGAGKSKYVFLSPQLIAM